MDRPEKIVVLNNEIEASLIDQILKEKEIPHIIRSYRDLVYDGLWQTPSAWGELQAPPSYRQEILAIYEEITQNPPDGYPEEQE